MSDCPEENPGFLERTRDVALEFCDESDIRFYKSREEYHVVLPNEYRNEVERRFNHLGWELAWQKENVQKGWMRLAFREKTRTS